MKYFYDFMFPYANFKTILQKAGFLMVFPVLYDSTCMCLYAFLSLKNTSIH